MTKNRVACFIAILLLLTVSTVHAQGTQPPIPAAPPEGSYVLDELDWLTNEQEANLNSIIRRLDHDQVAEIAVVTLDDCGSDLRAFRKSLFDSWGIGHADDHDGLLILVCWYGGDASRRSVEQIYGPGLNGILTSSKTGKIAQDKFVPAFNAGNPGDGLVGMVKNYNVTLRTSRAPSGIWANPIVQYAQGVLTGEWGLLWGAFLFIAIVGAVYKILPTPAREEFDRWLASGRDSHDDRDGFGGGHSDGGGGSSTRF